MGNNQSTEIRETSDTLKQYITTVFQSEEAMKTYYLQMANILHTTRDYSRHSSEYSCLKKLNATIKKYSIILQTINDHEWGQAVTDIQKILGSYIMKKEIDGNERRKINNEIASQMQFIVFLIGNKSIIKQLQGIATTHLNNIYHLLKSMQVPTEESIL